MSKKGISSHAHTYPNLDAEIEDPDDLFASPTRPPKTQDSARATPGFDGTEDTTLAREAALRRELESLRHMNQVISGITNSLEKARDHMGAVSGTVQNASALLNKWTSILSQTEHNQRLILNPSWHGATQDVVDGENEEYARQQEKERKEAEDLRKAKERDAQREEDERRRLTENVGSKPGRGRAKSIGRGSARGLTSSASGSAIQSASRGSLRGSVPPGRTISGTSIGRGTGRGRGRPK